MTLTELGGSAPVEKTQKSGLQIVSHQEQLASQVNSTHAYRFPGFSMVLPAGTTTWPFGVIASYQ